MRKSAFIVAIMAAFCLAMPQGAQAQSLLKKLGSALGTQATNATGSNVVGDLVNNILGKLNLTNDSIQGTWVYSQPCVAFESENVLTNLGGSVASGKIEKSLKALLQKAGFTEGKVSLTFNNDSTGVITCGTRNVDVEWALSGSDLTITFPHTQKSVKMNAKVSGGTLQVAMNADKLLTLVTTVTEKSSGLSTTMSTINTMMKNVKGMYLGLKYTRKK